MKSNVLRVALPLLALIGSDFAAAKDYPPIEGPLIETSRVNENGQRHDETDITCFDAPAGELLRQASVKTSIAFKENADEATCTPSFQGYVGLLPGISEPKRVCLRSYVKSVGGIINYGKRGRLQCSIAYSTHEGMAAAATPTPSGPDATATIAMLPATLVLERQNRALVTAQIPLAALQFNIDRSLKNPDQSGLPPGFSMKVMASRFEGVAVGSFDLAYYVDVDVSGPIGARCEVLAKFAIPAADARTLLIQDIGSQADCRTGSLIGQLAGLPTALNNAIRGAITDSLGKQVFQDGSSFQDWAKEDPEWAAMMLKAIVQGSYCRWRGQPALCLRFGWPSRDEINAREQSLLAKVPAKGGPIDRPAAEAKLKFFLDDAAANRMADANGIKYPSGRTSSGAVEDGDMAIFGGLLCRSGERLGCDLVRATRTNDGRFWRSPRRINEADTKDHASFSGDQLKGVLHYLSVTGDTAVLKGFLDYLRSKPTTVPDASVPLETGYSSCPNYHPSFTCLLSGVDWRLLSLLAVKHGLAASLPQDLPALEARYAFSYDGMVWESMMINNGYRLHLVANAAWTFRSLGETDERLAKVISIIAAREPRNPFFLYLLHGPDRKVQALADQKCVDPKTRTDFSDWSWQRAEKDEAWKRGMVWDCVFIYGLLTRDPIPAK